MAEDQDPYYHYLTFGKDQGLYTNLDAYNSSVEGIAQNIADTAEIAQTAEPDPAEIAIPQPEIAPEDEGEPTDPDMAEEVKDIIDIIDKGKNLPPQEGFEEFTEIQDPDDPDLQQTDPFLEDYLDQIDKQGEDFYGKDDTEFMAGDQGGPGSTLGELGKKPNKPTQKSTQAQQNLIDYNNKIALQRLQRLAQPTIMEPVESDEELGVITPYDFSSIGLLLLKKKRDL